MNYIEELKKCGDDLYKRGQYWEFINTVIKPDMIPIIKRDLGLKDKILKDNPNEKIIITETMNQAAELAVKGNN